MGGLRARGIETSESRVNWNICRHFCVQEVNTGDGRDALLSVSGVGGVAKLTTSYINCRISARSSTADAQRFNRTKVNGFNGEKKIGLDERVGSFL